MTNFCQTQNGSATTTKSVFAEKTIAFARWAAKPFLFTVLLVASSMAGAIPIPGTPVPVTLQTLVLCLIGLMLTCREAVASVVFYLALGAAGLPVFAGFKSGLVAFVGPTMGFLIGFIFGVAATAGLKYVFDVALDALMPERSFAKTFARFCTYFVASAIGTLVIYAFGFVGQNLLTGMPIKSIATASLGFILGDLIKAFIASAACSGLYNALNKKRA